ncbi:putative ring finger domain-containing protein [Erysiphe neolycopersici]|uniref:Putative ring finger domain-containing protein n=1 Tax=Erysiphe neolycopersici TaxID=212602 RepID=A0A420HT83_9PEZI|nr:putative ring finger domain-containing protein [Erysiphe neolycopersici]
MGLETRSAKIKSVEENEEENWKDSKKIETTEKFLGRKRKFQLDPEEVMRIVRDDTDKVKTAICEEKANRPTLPSFWAPSITPTSNTKNKLHHIPKKEKQAPICPASQTENPHIYSLHSLVDVVFTEEVSRDTGSNQRICPTCKKALTNTSKAMLLKNCGHVICKNCVSKLMTKEVTSNVAVSGFHSNKLFCFVCDTDIYGKENNGTQKKQKKLLKKKDGDINNSGLVEIRCEGTGFASSGLSTVEKSGVVFQC